MVANDGFQKDLDNELLSPDRVESILQETQVVKVNALQIEDGLRIAKAQLTETAPTIALNTVKVLNEYANGKISFERMAKLMGVNFDELHSIFEKAAQPIRDAVKEERKRIIPVGDKILELAEHGDYSNGIEFQGIDEGRVRASELLSELRKEWQALKEE